MFRQLILIIPMFFSISAIAQFKNDNVLFKTVDPSELCEELVRNKGYILLDVRSRGEHFDTSASVGYNLGHLKGAINIDIRELGNRLSELRANKDKPVFVYCSHSQRSRRASKILSDSGFSKVFNINGGLTALHYTGVIKKPCLQPLFESNNSYSLISAGELCEKWNRDKALFILDVRADSAFRHISLNAKENAYGYIRGSVNIPLEELNMKLPAISKEKEIIVTDIYGDGAAAAAIILTKNGYKNVSVLIEGIDRVLLTDEQLLKCKKSFYVSPVTYQLINVTEFGRFAALNKDYLLLDIRSTEEYANKHKDIWRNIGNLKNAVNIPLSEWNSRMGEIEKFKQRDVVIYSFSSSPEVFDAANRLRQQGFKSIKVIIGGLFNLRWTAANTKGNSYLATLVTNIPEENR